MLPPSLPFRRLLAIAACGVFATIVCVPQADTVLRRDGSRIEGRVVAVDAEAVTIDTDAGPQRVPRAAVASISFEAPAPPLKIEIRNVRADDAADLLVEGETVVADARDGGSWTDITARLKEGNNRLGLRIRNTHGTWAFRFHLRINGTVVPVSCGTPGKPDDPCTAYGHSGRENGTVEVGPIWLHVDRALGRAELLP